MSGLCGVLALKGQQPDESLLARMAETLHHRGPDGTGLEVMGPCGIAYTHLATSDNAADRHQPLCAAYSPGEPHDIYTTEALLAYNGQVYNAAEIRAQLEAMRHQFTHDSGAETLLHAYLHYGVEFIHPFRGAFALAVWDVTRERLTLIRDRLGEKPLYYAHTGDWLVFGSEIKALLAHPDVPRRLNQEAIPYFLAYGSLPAPHTLFEGIMALPPGTRLTASLHDAAIETASYWSLPVQGRRVPLRSRDEIAGELLNLLDTSISLRTPARVPISIMFSGRRESAALVALTARQERLQELLTFEFDLSPNSSPSRNSVARQIAGRYAAQHHCVADHPDLPELISDLVGFFDQPFSEPSAVSAFLLSQQIREYAPVALASFGGEGLFPAEGGRQSPWLARVYAQLPDALHRVIDNTLHRMSSWSAAERTARLLGSDLAYSDEVITQPNLLHSLLEAELDQEQVGISFNEVIPTGLLDKIDRTSMAASLEMRLPFNDHKLVQHMAAWIPQNASGLGAAQHILRKTWRTLLPERFMPTEEPDAMLPVDAWFRDELSEFAPAVLFGPKAAIYTLFDSATVDTIWRSHDSGHANLGYALWPLLTFELWMQRYF